MFSLFPLHLNPTINNALLCLSTVGLSICLEVLVLSAVRYYFTRVFPKIVIDFRKRFSLIFALTLCFWFSYSMVRFYAFPETVKDILDKILLPFCILATTYLLSRCIHTFSDSLQFNIYTNIPNNLRRRSLATQVQFLQKMALIMIWTISLIMVTFSFDGIRKAGMSLAASAGILSVAIGFSAQKSLANFLAGCQIAFTQPIRLDDVVIVEGEWGRIEEITLTYVVVCIWDLRRLILPINYFLEKPFQNWTRNSADILPYFYLEVGYGIPLEPVRKKFEEIVKQSKYFDGKLIKLHVTDSNSNSMTLRGLMSSSNASDAFELKCEVREHLIRYIYDTYPEHFSTTRFSTNDPRDPKYPRKFAAIDSTA